MVAVPSQGFIAVSYTHLDVYKRQAHLIELGHTRIGFIHGVEGSRSSVGRYEGYVEALVSHRMKPRPELVERGGFSHAGGLMAARKLLLLADPPTAVFAAKMCIRDRVDMAVCILMCRMELDLFCGLGRIERKENLAILELVSKSVGPA